MKIETVATTHPLVGLFDYFMRVYNDADRPLPTTLWRTDCGDTWWAWSTNGCLLIALRGPVIDPPIETTPAPEKMRAVNYLTGVPEEAREVPLATLVEFAGRVQSAERGPCEHCAGTGLDDDEAAIRCQHCGQWTRPECPECEGEKTVTPDIGRDYGSLANVVFNRRYLAYALSMVPPRDTVTVGRLPTEQKRGNTVVHHACLLVTADEWRFAIMSVLPNSADLVMDFDTREAKPWITESQRIS